MANNSNIPSIGRFSSQMLTYLGTQRTVRSVTGNPTNTFKYSNGRTVFPSAGSVSQAALGEGVVGNFALSAFDSTKCFFLSRGASALYADTMAALAIDMASMLGISPQALLEQSNVTGSLFFTDNAYRSLNVLRDIGNQVGTVTTVSNRFSLQARQIRS